MPALQSACLEALSLVEPKDVRDVIKRRHDLDDL